MSTRTRSQYKHDYFSSIETHRVQQLQNYHHHPPQRYVYRCLEEGRYGQPNLNKFIEGPYSEFLIKLCNNAFSHINTPHTPPFNFFDEKRMTVFDWVRKGSSGREGTCISTGKHKDELYNHAFCKSKFSTYKKILVKIDLDGLNIKQPLEDEFNQEFEKEKKKNCGFKFTVDHPRA